MAENHDALIRFLLPGGQARGALIHGDAIIDTAADIHGLMGTPLELFGQTLIASILLLSISKGGMRQVLQIDGPEGGNHPIRRILAEARAGAVRGYVDWHEGVSMLSEQRTKHGLDAWMGTPIKVSTVRDLGFGKPYVSVIEHDSPYLADQLVHYLRQSVQIDADLVLHRRTGLMIEAMPGSDDASWFRAVDALASIPDDTLGTGDADAILGHFAQLGCKRVGRDEYRYHCGCSAESLRKAMESMDPEALEDLADENGRIRISCQYCNRQYELTLPEVSDSWDA